MGPVVASYRPRAWVEEMKGWGMSPPRPQLLQLLLVSPRPSSPLLGGRPRQLRAWRPPPVPSVVEQLSASPPLPRLQPDALQPPVLPVPPVVSTSLDIYLTLASSSLRFSSSLAIRSLRSCRSLASSSSSFFMLSNLAASASLCFFCSSDSTRTMTGSEGTFFLTGSDSGVVSPGPLAAAAACLMSTSVPSGRANLMMVDLRGVKEAAPPESDGTTNGCGREGVLGATLCGRPREGAGELACVEGAGASEGET